MQQLKVNAADNSRCSGWGLTEALVALGMLSLGVLGLLWLQGKSVQAWRHQHSTEQAAWLVQDMAERMRANRGQLDAYRLSWGQAPNNVDCNNQPCALVEWAWADLWAWTREVQNRLPGAQTHIWPSPSDPRHIGIALAWRNLDQTLMEPTNPPAGLNCPAQHRCFWVHVRP